MAKPKTPAEDANEKRLDQNPLIGLSPSETIDNVVGALQWLNAADDVINDAFGGEPIDSIKLGRHLLGNCCIDALKAAGYEIDRERAAAKTKEEVSHG